MRNTCNILRDIKGVAAIEAALILPLFLSFLYGLFQLGFVFQANAGMQHGLGEAARFATIFPTPSDDAIKQRVKDSVFGTNVGTFDPPIMTTPEESVCVNCRDLSVTFAMPLKFLFLDVQDVRFTRSKRIFVASTVAAAADDD